MISSHIYTFLSVTLLFIGWLFLFPLVKLLSIIVPDCSTVYLISSLLFRLILYSSVNLQFVRLNIGLDKLRFFQLIFGLSCDCCAIRSQSKPDLTPHKIIRWILDFIRFPITWSSSNLKGLLGFRPIK